jgi:hypothetical protein
MGLDEVLDLQSLIELLRSQDPSSGTEPTIRVGRTSVLVPSGDHELVLVVMPGWREGGAAAPAPPPLEQDERVVAIVSVDCGDDVARAVAAQARAAGVPLHRLADLDGPLQIGALSLSPIDEAPGVVELIDDDDVFRVLIGTAIPLWAVPGPPETTPHHRRLPYPADRTRYRRPDRGGLDARARLRHRGLRAAVRRGRDQRLQEPRPRHGAAGPRPARSAWACPSTPPPSRCSTPCCGATRRPSPTSPPPRTTRR